MTLSFQKHWLYGLLLALVVSSNIALYHTAVGQSILPADNAGVVLGSMLDIIIVCPILIMLYLKKFSIKTAVLCIAAGCIAIRFIIPQQLFEPFQIVSYIGLSIELAFIAFELVLIALFIRNWPKLQAAVQSDSRSLLYALPAHAAHFTNRNPIVQILLNELLVFYYAFATWKKPLPTGLTLYKQSSLLAFQIMMIHAIVIETIGVHYWLHSKMPIVSLILLLFNIYSVLFFLADIQALRLNPIHVTDKAFYISLGLMKRATVDFNNIEQIIDDESILMQKLPKRTIQFVAKDFEDVKPQLLLKMKSPQKVTLAMGIEKEYDYVAIKVDDFQAFQSMLKMRVGY